MTNLLFALLLGLAAGFFGAIPPGPLNITIIRHVSHGNVAKARRVALGGSLVDLTLCGLIAVGLGWILEWAVSNRWVKEALALFLVAYGCKVLWTGSRPAKGGPGAAAEGTGENDSPLPRASDRSSRSENGLASTGLPFLMGVIQGAANPALFVNWTLFVSFAVGHGLLRTTAPDAAAFAVGVGLGVLGWFEVVIEIIGRLRRRGPNAWLRASTVVAGLALVGFGLYFGWRSAGDLIASHSLR